MGVDDSILREVIIPVMAIDRRAMDGTTHAEERILCNGRLREEDWRCCRIHINETQSVAWVKGS